MLSPEANITPAGVVITHEDGSTTTLTMAEAQAVASVMTQAGPREAARQILDEHARLSAIQPGQ